MSCKCILKPPPETIEGTLFQNKVNFKRDYLEISFSYIDRGFDGSFSGRRNITLLAVHRNVVFHDRPGHYLYNIFSLSLFFSPLSHAL